MRNSKLLSSKEEDPWTMISPLGTPKRAKASKSYLDKGPSKEQVARRNFLKGRLFDSDANDDAKHEEEYFPLNDSEEFLKSPSNDLDKGIKKKKKKKSRLSHSLSPTPMLRKRAGLAKKRVEKSRSRSRSPHTEPRRRSIFVDDDEDLETYTSLNDSEEFHVTPQKNEASSRGRLKKIRMSRSLSPKQIGQRILGRSKSRKKDRNPSRSRSPSAELTRRSSFDVQSGGKKDRNSSRSRSPSLESTQRPSLGILSRGKSRQADGLADMRRSLMADKARLDSLRFDDTSSVDESSLLERAARRVIERRKKVDRSKTDNDGIERMQRALRKREELERKETKKAVDESSGIFSRGLKALEKVYDDLNG